MKIVIAPDKFKGSLTGADFCDAVEKGIKKHNKTYEIVKLPLADGGDCTVEVLQFYTAGKYVSKNVQGPLKQRVDANYLFSSEKEIAFVEMAEASGIRLLKTEELNPLAASTFGTGELIADAINNGAKQIILGIGGSATNDAGMGMAKALGFRFFDKKGKELSGTGADLNLLHSIDSVNVIDGLSEIEFKVACDVENPLFGPNGAAFVYGPQKGANQNMVNELDSGLINFNKVVKKQFGIDLQNMPGAGAAGGLGAGCVLFLHAVLKSGIELIKDFADFESHINNADWIITGEGKLDEQTFSGKVIKGILNSRSEQKLAIFCGKNELNTNQIKNVNINYIDEIINYSKNLADSIKNAGTYLELAAAKFALNKLM